MNELVQLKSYKEENIIAYANSISQEVFEGNTNPIAIFVQAKAIKDIADKVIDSIKDLAIDEADNYSKAESSYNGASFSLKKLGDTLNYDQDEIVKDLNKQLKERKKLLKQSYDLFKTSGKTVIDEEGEIVPVVGLKTEGSTTISVTFKEKK